MALEPVRYINIKGDEGVSYDGVSLGETMIRFDPMDVPTSRARIFRVSQGGGETNVACGLSYAFGFRTAVLTAFVDDNFGRNIENQLKEMGVDTSQIIWWNTRNTGGPYSTDDKGAVMNGINATYNGAGVLPSVTDYYRGNTAARLLKPGDFDFDMLFGKRGVRVFNTGGIFTLIGDETAALAIKAAQKAAEHGTFVSADLNYRSKVQPNKDVARQINKKLAPHLGMLVGNDSDLHDALGYETGKPNVGPNDPAKDRFAAWLEQYRQTIEKVASDYPNLSLIGTQWRDAINADVISWGGVLFYAKENKWYISPVWDHVTIRDRTGGGDSFASGVLGSVMRGYDLETAVGMGAAHGIAVQATPGDVTMVRESDIKKILEAAKKGSGTKAQR